MDSRANSILLMLKEIQRKIINGLASKLIFDYQIRSTDKRGIQIIPFSGNFSLESFEKLLGILYLLFKETLRQVEKEELLSLFQVRIEKSNGKSVFLRLRIPTFELVIDCPSEIFEALDHCKMTLRELEKFAEKIEDFKEKDLHESFEQTISLYRKIANYIRDCNNDLLRYYILFRLYVDLKDYFGGIIANLIAIYEGEISYYIVYDGDIRVEKVNKSLGKTDVVVSLPGIPLIDEFFRGKNKVEISDFFKMNNELMEELILELIDISSIRKNLPNKLRIILEELKNLRDAVLDIESFFFSLRNYCEKAQCVLADLILLENILNSKLYFQRAFNTIKILKEDEVKEFVREINEIKKNEQELSVLIRNLDQINKILIKIRNLLSSPISTVRFKEYIDSVRSLENHLDKSILKLEELTNKVNFTSQI